MLGFINWIASLLIGLLALLLVTFAFTHIASIDPVIRIVGDKASQATYDAKRAELGLDKPLPQQFLVYAGQVLRGDLGTSWSTGQPVASDLVRVFPATFELATVAIIIGGTLGVGLGLLAGLWPGGWRDSLVRVISLLGYSVPIFWLGLLSLLLFYARLHWFGGPGRQDVAFEFTTERRTGMVLIDTWLSGDMGAFRDAISHIALPALVLAFYSLAGISRLTRTAVLEELGKEYVVTARAKGAGQFRIIFRHVLPNIRASVITVVALSYAVLLEGAVFTETVFAWPGIGRYLTISMFAADVPAILGGTLVIGVCFIILNTLTDLIVGGLDPRLKP
ncbi:ABC transporter permease [Kaistia dalseonensis]|uniref:Peptide/nickel transport system permease protein n=1 Tax=Kaistia dalseonensis TaxID=410840 RepID=A0ABU0H8J0_9HYPH|nr:ABC transporter permease [Kaistia dalseonensis]MCX5496032.1 ABC transporter permease [Kaistia dalseonensis]MDQ0438636.1 peptide/nickel transport system permease protein [Kaistia dalseonensis]